MLEFVGEGLFLPTLGRRRGGGQPWSPADLPGVTAFYDPSDLSTMYQDADGTIPVTATEQPVGLMLDKSPNGNHATQSVSARRPVYRTAGGLHWLGFDGVDDRLLIPNTTDGALSSDNTAVFGVQPDDGANFPYLLGGNAASGFGMIFFAEKEVIRVYTATKEGLVAGTGTTVFTNTSFIYSAGWSRTTGRLRGWVNQVLEVDVTGTPADKTESATYALGGGGDTSLLLKGRIYGGVISDIQLSDADRQAVESFMAQRSGVAL